MRGRAGSVHAVVRSGQMCALPGLAHLVEDAPRATRGRGATPIREHVMTLKQANPTGRRKLVFRYRPLKRHVHVLPVAERLVAVYFAKVGGFRLADDEVMRLWGDALADYSEQEILWAIEVKAASLVGMDAAETAFKATFRGSPAGFIARGIGYWLEQSAAYRDALADRGRGDAEALHRRLTELRCSGSHTDVNCGAPATPSRPRNASPDAILSRLSDTQRTAALRAVDAAFRSLCANYGWENPAEHGEQRAAMAAAWAVRQWPHAADVAVQSSTSDQALFEAASKP